MDFDNLSAVLLGVVANSVIDRVMPKAEDAVVFTATEVAVVSKWLFEHFGSAVKGGNGAHTRYRKLNNKKRG